jgi:hypothetical protein
MAPCFYIYILYSLFTFMDKLEREFMDSWDKRKHLSGCDFKMTFFIFIWNVNK